MTRHRIDTASRRFSAGMTAWALLATLAVASCSKEIDDTSVLTGDPQPVRVTALAPQPLSMSRSVAGKTEWKGDGTEKIGIYYQHETEVIYDQRGRYTIIDKAGNTQVMPGDTAIYLRDKNPGTFTAYYPGDAYNVVYWDITDQSTPEKLKRFDFLRCHVNNHPFGEPLVLEFKHQMAKIRIEVTGDHYPQKAEAAIYNQNYVIFIGSVPQPYHDTFWPGRMTWAYIQACRDPDPGREGLVAFEVLLAPERGSGGGTLTKKNTIRLNIDGKEYYFAPHEVELEAGQIYTFQLTLPE